jgi:predicted ester cyclase
MQLHTQKADLLEANKAVVRAWVGARNANDLEAALAVWTEDNRGRVTKGFAAFGAGFPDIHITMEEIIAEGDKVVLRFKMHGTHLGTWAGVPATRKPVSLVGIDIYTVKDGKLADVVRSMPNLKAMLSKGD